jgi:signal transduction histidine kinase
MLCGEFDSREKAASDRSLLKVSGLWRGRLMSPVQIILRLALVLVSVECVITLALSMLAIPLGLIGIRSEVGVAIVHGVALVSISSVVLYFWIIRPLISARQYSEATLRDVAETLSEGFLMYDAEDRLILCNSKFRELYSLSSDVFVLGRKFEDILRAAADRGQYPEAIGRIEEWIAERLRQHRHLGEPIERQLPNGRWVKITETRTSTGYTVGIRTEITELKRREQLLRKSEEQLHQIVASLQEGFVLYDADDRVVMWNAKWTDIHKEVRDIVKVGLSFEELARECVARRIYPEAHGREEEFISERVAHHRNPGQPIIRRHHDDRWYIIREVPTAEGGIFALSIDITDLKKAESAAEKARMEAEYANRAKSRFLTNMSHELRTPLNAIIGFSDIIQNEALGPVGSVRYQDYAKDINQSGRHLLALITDILDLSKVESGMDELHEENINVGEITRSVVQFVRQRAERERIKLEIQAPDDPPALFADGRKVTQILVNLMTNAVKFTEPGGTVTIRIGCRPERGYVFEVADTGIGIAPEDIPRALSQFGQVENPRNQNHEGTGLGLPLTKALVELHGGCLDIQSEIGVGTTITVCFPAGRIVETLGQSDRSPAA